MGKLNQLDDPEVCRVIDEVCAKTRKAGVMLGTAGGPLKTWVDRGVQWIASTSDCGSIFAQAQTIVKNVPKRASSQHD